MYKLKTTIKNPLKPCLIPEVAFHPDGSMFGATYGRPNHEVHIFDAKSLERKHVLKNPDAKLEDPHGILFTKNHLIITNVVDRKLPATINVYRLDGLDKPPVHTVEPSFKDPVELHSVDIYNDIIVMTCCETPSKQGAVVSFRFNDDTGELSTLDKQEECFKELGDTKGISFNHDGTKLYVTFESDRIHSGFDSLRFRLSQLKDRVAKHGLLGYLRLKQEKRKKPNKVLQPQKPKLIKNGITVLDIDNEGKISSEPTQIILQKDFCRYENVNVYGNILLLTDTINNEILFYDLHLDPNLEKPMDVLKDSLTLPHGTKLSPDRKRLIVTNYGLKTIGQQISWGNWTKKRGDNILIFEKND